MRLLQKSSISHDGMTRPHPESVRAMRRRSGFAQRYSADVRRCYRPKGSAPNAKFLSRTGNKHGKYLTLNSGFFRFKLFQVCGIVGWTEVGEAPQWLEKPK